MNALSYRFKWFERVTTPPPLALVKDGTLLRRNMRREFVTEEELMGQLHKSGIPDLSQVKHACVEGEGEGEGEGEISFVTGDGNRSRAHSS